ncbi:hypothetical protein M911_09335 [Ectothiorhodospira haloalkaliphila]|uniref:Peptidase n=1 Tax=Ectothiorhodospira haloalkaliphila TaxID=421628 RepID=W8LA68_9GAMM|nr:SapC family protein [Ectothiorhodospira haloalkaliphila]AHK80700.1 hypothetical protein M911_09335 [Ectothiorhodospira haloalkaliphila]
MNLVPISPIEHKRHHWRAPTSQDFARDKPLIPLVAAELPKAALAAPIVMTRHQEAWVPQMLMGFETGRNLMIARNGLMIADYTPILMRLYPFRAMTSENGDTVLCFDEGSGLITKDEEATPFFDAHGVLSAPLQRIMDSFRRFEDNRLKTIESCALLGKHDLFEPWPMAIRKTDESVHLIDGLFRVNERALKALKGPQLEELHRGDALALAYCQLLSMNRVSTLVALAGAHQQLDRAPSLDDVGMDTLAKPDAIVFDWDDQGQ